MYVCVYACIKPDMNCKVFNLYKLQIEKLQSVQHLHLLVFFFQNLVKLYLACRPVLKVLCLYSL